MDEFMTPELELWVFHQFNKGDEKTPWMWPVYNQSLQQHPVNIEY